MAGDSLVRYEFSQQLERLRQFSGRATELISLYVPPERKIHEVMSYLRNEASQSSNIKSKSTRKNVGAALESIMSRLKAYKAPPETGLIFFVGHVSKGAGQTEMIQEVVAPPESVGAFLYRCDNRFFLEPLEQLQEIKEQYALLVIDRSEATLGLLRGARIKVLKHMFSQVPSKHGKGGQSRRRFERLIEEAAHEWYKRVAGTADDFFCAGDIEAMLIGGPGATKDYFIGKEYLQYELQGKVLSSFDTGYTDETGLRELVTNAAGKLQEVQLIQEKQLMERFMQEVMSPRKGLATYGEKQVREALQRGAVDQLLVSEVVDQELVRELATLAEKSRSSVELVSTDTEGGAALQNAFGGVAAILRYAT